MPLTKIKLGELIEQITETNENLLYGLDDVMGMTLSKEIIPTKADINPKELPKFTVVSKDNFIFNPRTHGEKIGFGFNDENRKFLISWNNIAFKIKNTKTNILNAYYLWMWLKRDEWDRFATFNSWGSSTEVFSWNSLCDMEIELPDIKTQQKFVNIYCSLVNNQKSFEKGLEDLKSLYFYYIEKLKSSCDLKNIGDFIKTVRLKNTNNAVKDVCGVSNSLKFIEASSSVDRSNLKNYKIVNYGDIAYVPTTHMKIWAVAISDKTEPFVVSPIYEVFSVTDKKKIYPEFLYMWLCRKETIRFGFYNSWGSARENFSFDDLCTIKMPIPSIETQKSIVCIFKTYERKKEINEKLKEQISNICPILIKGSIEEAKRS